MQTLVQVHIVQTMGRQDGLSTQDTFSTIHFMETVPSILHEIPWIALQDNIKVIVEVSYY